MRYIIITLLLLAGAACCGCGKGPEWIYYGEVASAEYVQLHEDTAWTSGRYINTYTLTDGRKVVDYSTIPPEGLTPGGYLYGQNKNGNWQFEVRPTATEEK